MNTTLNEGILFTNTLKSKYFHMQSTSWTNINKSHSAAETAGRDVKSGQIMLTLLKNFILPVAQVKWE